MKYGCQLGLEGSIGSIQKPMRNGHYSLLQSVYKTDGEKHLVCLSRILKKTFGQVLQMKGVCIFLIRIKIAFQLYDKSITNLQCLTETSDGKLWGGNYTSIICD